ncbi:uncharacterized protein LOC135347879 [Halichondria panicea]|uniref:uncharacterized protein LOC135347879 n=1 Tax=Halichondria panicea TaxID=6063 RepID=UPI00312B6FC2
MYQEELDRIKVAIADEGKKRHTLQNLDCFVLDNSLRESTVGQLRGHTIENKWKIYNEVKKCGLKNIIVASFSHMTRVDDLFIKQLTEKGEDPSTLYAFSEVTAGVSKGVIDRETIPVGLAKMKKHGLKNPIIEFDLADKSIDWESCSVKDICELIMKWIEWSHTNLSKDSKIFVNFRDFPMAMIKVPERVLAAVDYFASLPQEKRLLGIIFEEPTGDYLPEEIGAWTTAVRNLMNARKWNDGLLLVHVHKKWGLAETVQLECLCSGANGIWASVAEEGAAMGHACSSITLMNLIRMGNKKVLERYNCTYLRKAAIAITSITTGNDPHPKQVVYGERALDMSFDFGGIAGGHVGKGEFDIAKFFGEKPPVRISTLASTAMIITRLNELFGSNPQFNQQIAEKMKEVMLEDLRGNRKEEYMSEAGLAVLFDRSGGQITNKMGDVIARMQAGTDLEKLLITEIKERWDTWDLQDKVQGDDALQFDSFYNGFMAPYFGCFKCNDTKAGLKAMDMDSDGFVDWKEFLVYLKWAVHEYDVKTADELLSIAFRKGLIPAMRDELQKS